ncbi:MAG: hypothetical protein V3V08_22820 [Nannocystaceae bacterium]
MGWPVFAARASVDGVDRGRGIQGVPGAITVGREHGGGAGVSLPRTNSHPTTQTSSSPHVEAEASSTQKTGLAATDRVVVDRPVRLMDVVVLGREQVSARRVDAILRAEDLVRGAVVAWPDDPRVATVREQLVATGYFRRVTLRLRPLPGARDRAVLTVELQERSSLVVSEVYAASSTFTPFHGGVALLEQNFLGRAVHLGGALVWGTVPVAVPQARRQQSGRVSVEAPRLTSSALGFAGSFYYVSASEPYKVAGAADDPTPRLFRTLDYSRVGGVLGATIPFSVELSLAVDYRFEQIGSAVPVDVDWVLADGRRQPVSFGVLDGSSRLTTAEFGLRWDGRERQPSLGRGARFALDIQLSSPILGSDYAFIKVRGGAAYSFRLPWRHWLTPGLFGGQLAGDAPDFELFHAGDVSEWTPGREQGLVYSTRAPLDVFGTGVDTYDVVHLFARGDLEYAISLFRRPRTSVVESGYVYMMAGTYLISGDGDVLLQREAIGLPPTPLGLNANLGLRIRTSFGTFDMSVGNFMRRLPL